MLDTGLLLSVALIGLTYLVLAGGWRMPQGALNLRPSRGALLMSLLAVGAAIWFYGLAGGIAIIVIVMVHEYGHVAAFRVAGHPDATFRLIPFFGGVAISRREPTSQLHDFYITAMGPGISLALMCSAFALAQFFNDGPVANFLFLLGALTGLINFFNLLPLWPLDGGRMLYAIVAAFSSPMARRLLYGMTGFLFLAAILMQSVLLLIFGFLSMQNLSGSIARAEKLAPLTPAQALHGVAILLLMLVAFYRGGAGFLAAIVPGLAV